jgi:hypothetical protein
MVKFRMRLIDAVKLKQDDAQEVFECSMFHSFHPVCLLLGLMLVCAILVLLEF